MRSVNVAELENRRSKYLTFAKAGEEVVIRNRNLPVANMFLYSGSGNESGETPVLVHAGNGGKKP